MSVNGVRLSLQRPSRIRDGAWDTFGTQTSGDVTTAGLTVVRMTTTTLEISKVLGQRAGSRLGAIAGLAFAASLFVGVAMLDLPKNATDQELVSWWADGGHRTAAVVSMYLFVVAGLCFLVFLVKLRTRLLAAEGGAGELTTLVVVAGVVFVAMLLVAAASRGVLGFAVDSPANDESLPGPDTLRYLPQIGYAVTGTGGLLAGALTMATTSFLVVRTAVFGRWLAWVGVLATLAVVGAAAALSAVFAIPAVLVWALATSVALWRDERDRS
jgi:hypothetical protein